MTQTVRVEDADGIREITLARPARKNALDVAMYEALVAALLGVDEDDTVRAVILRGEGPAFCAGNDLHDFLANPPNGPSSPVMRFLAVLVHLRTPLIAAVRGPAIGIGTTVLLHCDLAFAAPDARFQLPFARLGLVPEAGSSHLLPRLIGHQRAFARLVLGAPFGAEEALADGLISGIASDPEAAAREAAAQVAALPPEAVRASKALLRTSPDLALADAVAAEGQVFIERLASPELQQAVAAFFARKA